ncbi:MAG TPA: hypothetical protein VHK90_09065 [Thermoanaerobaculia bacterium]|nr:hypothetical protein [Thermoanaerobaculia bacterium]
MIASPDFTWYLTQLGVPAGVLVSGEELLVREPFAGATTTPAAVFLMVLTFAALQLTAAFVATRVARFVRTREELALRVQDHRADTLPARALDATPAAAVIVVAATGQVIQASKRFTQQMLLHNVPVVGRELPELLAFEDADELRTLLVEGGSIPHCRYRVGPEERIARVSVAPFEHDGTAYANVVIDDEADASEALPVALLLVLLCVPAANAQDALVAGASADRLSGGSGGSASVLWIHPRAHDTLTAGATVFSLDETRWAYATLGVMRRTAAGTMLHGEANLGGGRDDDGRFPYVLVRAGATHELLARRLYAEGEWLQVDVARQQDAIARIGGTFVADPRLTMRASLFQSLFGDNDITLGTIRADYDLSRVTVIAGFSGGTAVPALLQGGDDVGRVREAFAGAAFDAASRRWTVIVTSREDHQRISVTCRMPLQ